MSDLCVVCGEDEAMGEDFLCLFCRRAEDGAVYNPTTDRQYWRFHNGVMVSCDAWEKGVAELIQKK